MGPRLFRDIGIFVYGDSLSLPRAEDGIGVLDTYPELVSAHLEQRLGSRTHLYNRSRPSVTISEIYGLSFTDRCYFDKLPLSLCIIQSGIVDCAPRPVPSGMRKRIDKLPEPIRRRIVASIHRWRPFLVRNQFFTRVSPPELFGSMLGQLIREVSEFHDAVLVVNIAPSHPNIHAQSPELPNSISLYNRIIAETAAACGNRRTAVVDVFAALGRTPADMDRCINRADGHHLTLAGHEAYADLVESALGGLVDLGPSEPLQGAQRRENLA